MRIVIGLICAFRCRAMCKMRLGLESKPMLLLLGGPRRNMFVAAPPRHLPGRELSGSKDMPVCEHIDQVKDVKPHSKGCEECLKMGDTWVHLRLCMSCGHVGCCDSSKNKHATKHFHKTKHPIIKSLEPGEDWGWCFVDEIELESV
jgi:hypothetical protein